MTGRLLAIAALIVTAPIALTIMLLSGMRGENPLLLRLGVRPQRNVRISALRTFAYYELAGDHGRAQKYFAESREEAAALGMVYEASLARILAGQPEATVSGLRLYR